MKSVNNVQFKVDLTVCLFLHSQLFSVCDLCSTQEHIYNLQPLAIRGIVIIMMDGRVGRGSRCRDRFLPENSFTPLAGHVQTYIVISAIGDSTCHNFSVGRP